MKNVLVFTPQWSTSHPYLSLPYLKAYLNNNDIDVDQLDLNIEFYRYMISIDFIELCKEKMLSNIDYDEESKTIYMLVYEYIINNIHLIDRFFKDRKLFFDYCILENIKILTEEIYNFISLAFNPFKITFDHLYFGENLSLDNIDRIIKDEGVNPFYQFSMQMIDKHNLSSYDFIGISLVSINQLIPSLTLCYCLKKLNNGIHINIGGNHFSHLSYKKDSFKGLFHLFDSILLFEGEDSLYKLISCLEKKTNIYEVSDCITLRDGEIFYSGKKSKKILEASDFPNPDFEGLKLQDYTSPCIILPYNISRGCFWKKCTFCDHDYAADGNYRIKDVRKVIKDFVELKEKYNAEYIYIIDEALTPLYIEKLSDKIIKEKLKINWFLSIKANSSFNYDLCNKMKEAGCVNVFIGIESCSDKLLNDMDKGITTKDIGITIENMDRAGIWTHSFMIDNFPTETYEDKLKTILFVDNNKFHSIGLSKFNLTKHSKIMNDIDKYNINEIAEKKNFFSYSYDYSLKDGEVISLHDKMSQYYDNRIYNQIIPGLLYQREHLSLYVKRFSLVEDQSLLTKILKSHEMYRKEFLLYKSIEEKGSLYIYNLVTKKAIIAPIYLSKILNNLSVEINKKNLKEYVLKYWGNKEEVGGYIEFIEEIFEQ